MTWLILVGILIAAYVAYKVVSMAIKVGLFLLIAAALYWYLAPQFGLPMPWLG